MTDNYRYNLNGVKMALSNRCLLLYDKINPQVLELVSKDGKVYDFSVSAYIWGIAFNASDFVKAGLMNSDITSLVRKRLSLIILKCFVCFIQNIIQNVNKTVKNG